MNSIKEKMKSWTMWVSLAALICWFVTRVFGIDISDDMTTFMDVLFPVLVGFGIVNNPNSRDSF